MNGFFIFILAFFSFILGIIVGYTTYNNIHKTKKQTSVEYISNVNSVNQNEILTDIMSKYNPNKKTVIVDKWIDCYHIIKADYIVDNWIYTVCKTWPTDNVSCFGITHEDFVKMLNNN